MPVIDNIRIVPPAAEEPPAMSSPPSTPSPPPSQISQAAETSQTDVPNASGPSVLRKPRGRATSVAEPPRGRSVSAQPPSTASEHSLAPPVPRLDAPAVGRDIRSHSAHSSAASSQSGNTAHKRRSWLPGGSFGGFRSRSSSQEPPPLPQTVAWVLASDSHADYNVGFLVNGERVPELWDENGTLLIYLSSPESGAEPSFRVLSSVIEESPVLRSLLQTSAPAPPGSRSRARSFGGRDSLSAADACYVSTPSPVDTANSLRLYLSVANEDPAADPMDGLELLMPVRNLFALLTGQPLVGTRNSPSVFSALMAVATLLRDYDFGGGSNSTGASFGEAVDVSLSFFVDQNNLADVRNGREKTLEALVLGEQLRFLPLYNEAFCHAVGKYPALRELLRTSPLWQQVSGETRQRLERAHLDLLNRQHSVNNRLEQFEFPSLFAGVANSTSNESYRTLRFKNWRVAFADMRSFVIKYYKTKFGSWPPKASSRRNPFTESGLNRLVLRTLYTDLCAVYDLIVDRSALTPRVIEDPAASAEAFEAGEDSAADSASSRSPVLRLPEMENSMKALRQILSEFDQSSPPVLPAMPYDTPLLPSMAVVRETYPDLPPKDQARFDKSVQPYELQQIFQKSHNADAECPDTSPFLAAFEAFELHEARRGKSNAEIAEMRVGYWLFLYVVLQSMPMLVIDAPELAFGEGVEYFLCEPSQGRPPWVEDAGEVRKAWFQTAGGAGHLVELSADVLLYSVEATYHRSHCWQAAKEWETEATRTALKALQRESAGTGQISLGLARTDTADTISADVSGAANGVLGALRALEGAGTPGSGTPGSSGTPATGTPMLNPLGVSASVPDLPRLRCSSISAGSQSVVELAGGVAAAELVGSTPTPSPPLFAQAYFQPQLPQQPSGYDRNDSPELDPLSPTGTVGTNSTARSTSTPTTANSAPSCDTPPSLASQLHVPGMLPKPQQRSNYLQLQQRADLRRASIGWALEPVKFSDDETHGLGLSLGRGPSHRNSAMPMGQSISSLSSISSNAPGMYRAHQSSPGLVPPSHTRRIVSAGNLRMLEGEDGNNNNNSISSLGSLASNDLNRVSGMGNMDSANGMAKLSKGGKAKNVPANPDSTFDSILGNMDVETEKEKKKKKRQTFLPFR